MGPADLFGAAIQYFKSLPFGGKWAKFQPPLTIAFSVLLGTAFFVWATPNAMALDWRTFLLNDWDWIKGALGTGAAVGLLAQSGVNLGAFKATSWAIPNSNPTMHIISDASSVKTDESRVNRPGGA